MPKGRGIRRAFMMKIVSAVLRDIFDMLIGILLFGILFTVFCKMLASPILLSDSASAEIGVERARSPVEASCAEIEEIPEEKSPCVLTVYREGDGPAPAWYRPDEPMAVEWFAEDTNVPVKDIGCPDYNVESTLWGWDGHCMESWEMEMFARIAYLECRGCSRECQEAVVDAILRLWESEYYSTTLYGTLSAVNEDGTYAYSPYPTMWDEEYNPDILAEMRELCEERFYNSPEYTAPFFRTKYYHDWAVPCYCFPEDNVYFSTFKEGV